MGGVRGREAGDRVWIRSERALGRGTMCGIVASEQKAVTIAEIILVLQKRVRKRHKKNDFCGRKKRRDKTFTSQHS